jgi:hypothetical protein
MKLRESGMPEQSNWETHLEMGLILNRLGTDNGIQDVVKLGECK